MHPSVLPSFLPMLPSFFLPSFHFIIYSNIYLLSIIHSYLQSSSHFRRPTYMHPFKCSVLPATILDFIPSSFQPIFCPPILLVSFHHFLLLPQSYLTTVNRSASSVFVSTDVHIDAPTAASSAPAYRRSLSPVRPSDPRVQLLKELHLHKVIPRS